MPCIEIYQLTTGFFHKTGPEALWCLKNLETGYGLLQSGVTRNERECPDIRPSVRAEARIAWSAGKWENRAAH